MTLKITANAMNDMTNRADVPPSNYMILNNRSNPFITGSPLFHKLELIAGEQTITLFIINDGNDENDEIINVISRRPIMR